MVYTIGEIAKKMKVAPSTLRYYDKEGLLPFIARTEGGIRFFTEKDYEGLSVIHCLKQAGLSIKDIKKFVDMIAQGDETIHDRLELFQKKREDVAKQLEELQHTLDVLDYKCWFYETSEQIGATSYVENMPPEDMPPKYAEIRAGLSKL